MNSIWKRDNDLYNIADIILKHKIISFDIFDTLVFRSVEKPEDIFELIYDRFKVKIWSECPIRKEEFRKMRILAEKKARKNKIEEKGLTDNEVNLDEIYNELIYLIKYKNELINIEKEIEKENIYLNPVTYSLLQYAYECNKKIILVSDMYLKKNEIIELLNSCGVSMELIDNIFVSCEYQKTKHSGKLYKKVLDFYNIKPKEILHIGDNEYADIERAKLYNINSVKYNCISKQYFNFELEKIKFGFIPTRINSLRKIAINLSSDLKDEEKFWFEIGVGILGPFLTFLSQWTIDIAKKNNVSQIYPLMREGVILGKTLRQAASYNNAKIDIKELFVSRQSTGLASLNELNDEYIDKYFLQRIITVDEMLKLLGIHHLNDKFLINIRNKSTSKLNSEEIKKLKEIIFVNKENIDKTIIEKKELLIKYLKHNINLDKKFMTIDLGYRGTIQENLNLILKDIIKQEDIVHILGIGDETICDKMVKGIDIRPYVSSLDDEQGLTESILWDASIIEEFMNDERGSTTGYELNNNKVEPIIDENRIPDIQFKYKKICQDGILLFQKLFYETIYVTNKSIDYEKYSKSVMIPISRLLEVPIFEEAQKLILLNHDENAGTQHVSTIITEKDKELVEKYDYYEFMDNARRNKVSWSQGLAAVYYPNKTLLDVIKNGKLQIKYFRECFEFVNELTKKNISTTIIYGAGEVGRALIKVLELHNIKVEFIIDRKSSIWGTTINGVEVISLNKLLEERHTSESVIIASFSFIDEIRSEIQQKLKDINIICIKIKDIG